MNEVVSAISNRIYDTFGPEYDIHLEEVDQDFITPAFCIVPLPKEYSDGIMDVEEHISKFDVVYYPKHEYFRQECIEIGEKLAKAFKKPLSADESLNTMPVLHVFDRRTHIIDNVLHFTFRLDFFADYYESDSDWMNSLGQKVEVKEND